MAEVIGNNYAAAATVASAASSTPIPGQLPPSPYDGLPGGSSSIAPIRLPSQPAMATSGTPIFPPRRNAQGHQQLQSGLPGPAGVRPPPLDILTAHHLDNDIDTAASPASLKPNRKRAAPIDVDNANQDHRLQDHTRTYPPDTGRPLAVEVGAGGFGRGDGGGSSELICLCTKAPKVPRPRNAFILYRQHHQASVAAEHPGLANPEISKLIGERWREQPDELKNRWKRLAEEEKARHQRQYPDYRYQPRRGGKNAQTPGNNHKPASVGEDPGRCAKCGGRYIATPRTPSTPFVAAAPPPGGAGGMPSYMTPNPRVIETDHMMRRGSGASIVSVDSHDRRYTGPSSMREVEEDCAMMSMQSPTHPEAVAAKRRRLNGSGAYPPDSPPVNYAQYPSFDPRYYQQQQQYAQQSHRLSVGALAAAPPPPSAAGGPVGAGGPLPRPSSGAGIAAPSPYRASISGMQPPPPRSSISYPASVSTPIRPGVAFDESLRLPPLQTQMPNPPSPHSTFDHGACIGSARPGSPASQGAAQTGLSASQHPMAARQQPQQQHVQHVQHAHPPQLPAPPPRYQFLLKLDMLRAISPPLKPPGPGSPPFETRGPLIAVEGEPGAAHRLLKATASVVEAALRVSDECVVRVWNGHEADHKAGHGASGVAEGVSSKNGREDDEGAREITHASPLASYVAEMLRWHRTSAELVKYMTTNPAPPFVGGEQVGASAAVDGGAQASSGSPHRKVPVAVVGNGYSLTQSDYFASALRIFDAYRPDDHWRWVATLWRGIVGPDLTIYVKLCQPSEIWTDKGDKSVEFANPGVMVLRVPTTDPALSSRTASGSTGGSQPPAETYTPHVDEKLERRLGFEIMEWVRSHDTATVGGRG